MAVVICLMDVGTPVIPLSVPACRYREFIADETKRKWEWQCRHEAEAAFWTSVVNGIIGKGPSALHLSLTPVGDTAVYGTCVLY